MVCTGCFALCGYGEGTSAYLHTMEYMQSKIRAFRDHGTIHGKSFGSNTLVSGSRPRIVTD